MANIDEIRNHLLRTVGWDLKRLSDAYDRHKHRLSSQGMIRQIYASVRMAQLRPQILRWNEIKLAIESDDPARVLPALERLIRHYRWIKFGLMLPSEHAGFQIIALASVTQTMREASLLFEHHRGRAA